MNIKSQTTLERRAHAVGISLYTMLAAVVVLGILASVFITQFNGDNSKGAALWALSSNVAAAAKQFHLHTGCYPTRLSALTDYTSARAYNDCNTAISKSVWDGPYINKMKLDNEGRAILSQYGAGVRLNLQSRRFGSSRDPQVRLTGLTESLIASYLAACDLPTRGGRGRPVACVNNRDGQIDFDFVPNY